MTSPLINEHFTASINLNSVKCAAHKVGFPGSCACAYSMGAKVPYPRFMCMRIYMVPGIGACARPSVITHYTPDPKF
jgi:hypothetical protein